MTITIVLPSKEEVDRIAAYTPEYLNQLKTAFDAVANPRDWKGPISAVIRESKLDITVEAIEFYTATEVSVWKYNPGICHVYSIGYRAGPAGDH